MILIIALYYTITLTNGHVVQTAGHIIYTSTKETPTVVNPKIVKFYRQFDLQHIKTSIDTLYLFQTQYKKYCDYLQTQAKIGASIVMPQVNFDEAQSKCLTQNGRIFEIRNNANHQALLRQMLDDNLMETYAGLKIDIKNNIRFLSDDTPNTRPVYRLCPNCTLVSSISGHNVQSIKDKTGTIIKFKYVIHYQEGNPEPMIVTAPYSHDPAQKGERLNTYCQLTKDNQNSVLNQIVRFSCARDQIDIQRTNEMLHLELLQIESPTKRTKRSIALVGAGLLGMDALISSFTGASPFSTIGQGIAYTLGIATHKDLKLTRTELEKHASQLTNISINQKALIQGYGQVTADIQRLDKIYKHLEYETAVLYNELDNKVNVYRLQSLVQHAIIKMVAAVTAGKQQRTSPYIFGTGDMQNITTMFRQQTVPLSNNVDDIITSVILVNNVYTFIIAIPILEDINAFYFYEIATLPIFKDGQGFDITIHNKFIAVNTQKLEFMIVTNTEYQMCTQHTMCAVAAPFERITIQAPCEIRSLQTKHNTCPIHYSSEARPTFQTFGNTTYYSVPKSMDIHLACKDNNKQFNDNQQIVHYGFFYTPTGCTVTINNEITIRPGYVVSQHFLRENTFLEILHRTPNLTNIPTTTTPLMIITTANNVFRDIDNFDSDFHLIFSNDSAKAEAIRIIFYILGFIALITFCAIVFPKFRLWLKTCTLTTKPSKYWSEVRGYVGPDYIRRNRNQKALPDPEAGYNNNEPSCPADTRNRSTVTTGYDVLQRRLRNIIWRNPRPAQNTPRSQLNRTIPSYTMQSLLPTSRNPENFDQIEIAPVPPIVTPNTSAQSFHTLHYLTNPRRHNTGARPKQQPPPPPTPR